ncbi:hypothetical protein G7Z17_g7110 [Cylindrodendrum hubeiense]|uniref:Uncharacterized protein n=1 Tax=Cylindrodendrum hubeiense TaxID=595255 RepID=A0A9P5HC10_9HYPO|nr:hypothetical protein G7Z17_g7110 [Cylindrodendrum hubeiense]
MLARQCPQVPTRGPLIPLPARSNVHTPTKTATNVGAQALVITGRRGGLREAWNLWNPLAPHTFSSRHAHRNLHPIDFRDTCTAVDLGHSARPSFPITSTTTRSHIDVAPIILPSNSSNLSPSAPDGTMAVSLSPEAFLPPGAFDTNMALPLNAHLSYRPDSSIATPSSSFPPAASHYQLPPYYNPHQSHQSQQQSQRGRLPPASSFPLQPPDAHPLSLSSLRAAQVATTNHSSKHLHVDASNNPRAASISPSRTVPLPIPDRELPQSSTAPLSSVPQYLAGASLSRSVSADAAPPTQQTSLYMVQRLVQQNSLIREAWEAERNYLETNRRRAEEVYQEERAIMDDVREGWESEKTTMIREIESLKERLHRLEGENTTLKAVTAQSIQGMVSPLGSQRGGSGDASMESSYFSAPAGHLTSRSPNPSVPVPTSFSMIDAASLPPGLDGASRRPHFRKSGSSRMSPTALCHTTSFVPMDPRMQPQNSTTKDFLSSPSDDSDTPVPIIDVQEIDPNLEGIPIKATAVQRSTFALGGSPPENPASPVTSPPPADAARYTEQNRGPPGLRGSSKEYTLQALAAVESRRLTMHAGHTPNHSLSLFPTVTATETNSIAGLSEGATPTAEMTADIPIHARESDDDDEDTPTRQPNQEEASAYGNLDDPEPMMEPDEDKPLKGPLMIKNIPAQDEIFWEAVNKKLAPISQGENALPAVMQTSPDDLESIADTKAMDALDQRPRVPIDPFGGDASYDPHADTDDDTCEFGDHKKVEADIPLRFKATSNFGAPFGATFGTV